jgi:hypothetical protein
MMILKQYEVMLVIKILNRKACNITGARGSFHFWVSAAECTKRHGFFEVLNNMSVKIFEDAATRVEYLFRIIH